MPVRRQRARKSGSEDATPLSPPNLQKLIEIYEKPGHLIRRLHQISTSIFIEQAKSFDLTQVQYATLVALEHCPGIDQAQLGKAVALDRTTGSVVVRRLVEKGLIDRKKRNGRKSALYLTGAGRGLIQAMRARMGAVDRLLLKPLSQEERGVFMQLLVKIVLGNNELGRAPHDLSAHPLYN
jgi:DNA-binding MarR family transcriptional regulator